jgi:hypothetical protein
MTKELQVDLKMQRVCPKGTEKSLANLASRHHNLYLQLQRTRADTMQMRGLLDLVYCPYLT